MYIAWETSRIILHCKFLCAAFTSRNELLSSAKKSSSTGSGTDLTGYIVALVAAIIGAVLTIAGELIFRIRDERKAFQNAKQQLLLELRTIFHECERRAALAKSNFPTVTVEPPLPQNAWTTLILSGQLRRLNLPQIEALNEFYREVESVNFRAAQVPILLQTVALSSQAEVQTAFSEEAERVSTAPYADMIKHRANLERVLGGS